MNKTNNTLTSKNKRNKIIMRMMKKKVNVALTTVIKTMRNATIPTKTIQTTTHHTIPMVTAVMKTIDLGSGKRNSNTLGTIVSLSTA